MEGAGHAARSERGASGQGRRLRLTGGRARTRAGVTSCFARPTAAPSCASGAAGPTRCPPMVGGRRPSSGAMPYSGGFGRTSTSRSRRLDRTPVLRRRTPSFCCRPLRASRTLAMGGLIIIRVIGFHPDRRRLIVSASKPKQPERLWAREIEGSAPPRPISPPGFYAFTSAFLAPDGRWAAAADTEGKLWLIPNRCNPPSASEWARKRTRREEQGKMV